MKRRELAIVIALFVLATALRLPGLRGDGLWRDEANVYVALTAPTFREFFARMVATEWHPPLYFLLMYGWTRIAGSGEIALTLVPFVFSVATVGAVYALGRTTGSVATGVLAATLYAVAPFSVAYASEYLYPLLCFLATVLAVGLIDAHRRPLTMRRSLMLAGLTSLVVFTHYTGLVFVGLLVVWTLASQAPLRRRLAVAATLCAGAFPFIVWLPVFFAQHRIGVPYQAVTAPSARLEFFVRTLAECLPLRSAALGTLFITLLLIALVVLLRVRAFDKNEIALGLIFLALSAFVAEQNLMASRYILAGYGPACVAVAGLLVRLGAVFAAAAPWHWARRRGPVAAVLMLVLVIADGSSAVVASAVPKSGIRTIVHTPLLDHETLYVIAPDYLASTFAFYTRHTPPIYAGFVRWDDPQWFRLGGYAADWNRADAVTRTLTAIAARRRNFRFIDVVVDDRAADQGQIPYGKVHALLRELDRRYSFLGRTKHPGRYEAVSEFRYALGPL